MFSRACRDECWYASRWWLPWDRGAGAALAGGEMAQPQGAAQLFQAVHRIRGGPGGAYPMASSQSNLAPKASANFDQIAVDQQSQSALISAKRNFRYLINPKNKAGHPAHLRTRALLRTVRYVSTFILWRLVRYAKYAAVGAVAAALGATVFGSAVTGVAWIAAPTSITAAIVSGTLWYGGKWAARRLHRRWEVTGKDNGVQQREEVMRPVQKEGTWRQETGPGAIPW
jgi:hypothetical protein